MAKPWKMMLTSKRGRVLLSASTSLTFLLKNSLKLQMIAKQLESNYRANRVTSLTSISIHRSRFLKWSPVKGRRGDRTRTVSRDFPRMRSVVASAIGSVTINLHASTTKFGLIATTEMTWYSEISSRMLSNRTGTALARLDNNRTDFTSKPVRHTGKNIQLLTSPIRRYLQRNLRERSITKFYTLWESLAIMHRIFHALEPSARSILYLFWNFFSHTFFCFWRAIILNSPACKKKFEKAIIRHISSSRTNNI